MIPSPATKSLLIRERLPELKSLLDPCRLCPRECLARRTRGETGECRIADEAIVSSVSLHPGEEGALSGTHGSGTIFLSGCNLHCIYCQNWEISQTTHGKHYTATELAIAMHSLQDAGAHNINWVSPTHTLPMLLDGLRRAYDDGLNIPLVYNTGGYDAVDTLRLLDGIVEIYMPDMKYGDSITAKRFSMIDAYVEHNQAAVKEMYRQVGPLQCDVSGVAYRGLLVRHLVLPDNLASSEAVLNFLNESLPGPVHINIMNQYRPCFRADTITTINRRIATAEYDAVIAIIRELATLHIID